MRTGWTPTRTRTILCIWALPGMALGVRRRSLPPSKRGRRRIVLRRSSLPPSQPGDAHHHRHDIASLQEAKISARRGPGTPVGLRPPSVPGPRHNPGVASLTLFVAPRKNARFHQICALIDRRLQMAQLVTAAHRRLQDVHVECLEWDAFIRRYDRPFTLFYIDPP